MLAQDLIKDDPTKAGTLQSGAYADLILAYGNPLKNLALLGDQGKHRA